MARPLRYWQPSFIYHVIINTHNKEYIFDQFKEKLQLLRLIKQQLKKFAEKKKPRIYIIAYAIMSNHIHMLIQLPKELSADREYIFSEMLRNGLSQFARIYNKSNERCGAVFLDRAKVKAIENLRYVREVIKYILMNPVRGGLIRRARNAKEGLSSYIMTIMGIKGEIDIIDIPEEMRELIKSIRGELEREMEEESRERDEDKEREIEEKVRGSLTAIGSKEWIAYIRERTKGGRKKELINNMG